MVLVQRQLFVNKSITFPFLCSAVPVGGKTYHCMSPESSCKAEKSQGLDRPVVEYHNQEVINEGSTSDWPSQTLFKFQQVIAIMCFLMLIVIVKIFHQKQLRILHCLSKPIQLRIFSLMISFGLMITYYLPAILTSMMPAVLDLMQTNMALFTLSVRYLVQVIFCFQNGPILPCCGVYQ